MYISKVAFDSLMEATFKETGQIAITQAPIVMTAEDLEEMAEGFTTAFDDNSQIKISAALDRIFATQFDSDFSNIPFKAELTVSFANPYQEKFLAAQAKVFCKGTAELGIVDGYHWTFRLNQEKVKVQKFMPYFLSEVELADFEETYLSDLHGKIFATLNKKFSAGIDLPFGLDLGVKTGSMQVSFHKDYILAQS